VKGKETLKDAEKIDVFADENTGLEQDGPHNGVEM
jgi:hypothetical protein